MKKIVVIDGQGGGLGRAIIEKIRDENFADFELIAVGTNAMATAQMMKAGADGGASGEAAVIWNCRNANLIVGPIGIMAAGSMLGELSPGMAEAIGSSPATKILLPVSKCHIEVVGITENTLPGRLDQMIQLMSRHLIDD